MNDQAYMKLAIQMASATIGQTKPNPAVGAVVVKDGAIVGMGAHLKAGEPHAEVHALNMAGDKAYGATIYVTLEPCSHYGKTPPCAELIIQKGIKRAVVASLDSNPLVSGRGMEMMKKAGIEVKVGVLEKEAKALNPFFLHFMREKRPFVTLKSAMSLDGKIATKTGESKWITGEQARLDGHRLRHSHDGILVGANTVIADNPLLTTRIMGHARHPIRIVLDTTLKVSPEAKIFQDDSAETWVITGNVSEEKKAPFAKEHVSVFSLQQPQNIEHILELLAAKGVQSLLVEGGATVHGAFLQSRLFDEVVSYVAPILIGGKDAPSAFGGAGFSTMAETQHLEIIETSVLGEDLKIVSRKKGK